MGVLHFLLGRAKSSLEGPVSPCTISRWNILGFYCRYTVKGIEYVWRTFLRHDNLGIGSPSLVVLQPLKEDSLDTFPCFSPYEVNVLSCEAKVPAPRFTAIDTRLDQAGQKILRNMFCAQG